MSIPKKQARTPTATASAAHFIPPMKAQATDIAPTADAGAWHCEIKFDGYRAIAVINEHTAKLWSRNRKPLDYPEVLPALEKLRCANAVLDGEIVALDARGRTDFQTLQGRDLGERPPIVYYAFDLLFLNGHDTTGLPFEERRSLLKTLLGPAKCPLQLSPTFEVEPALFLQKAREQGLEGAILKRAASPYEPNRRSGLWLKLKNVHEQEFVLGGYTPPRNSRQHIGALLVGYYREGKFFYAGKVGSGFTQKRLESLLGEFSPLIVDRCPFANLPLGHRSRFGSGMTPAVMRTVTWLKPKLVAQIKFAEWTDEGILRQPVFLGLRHDKRARSVARESGSVAPPSKPPRKKRA